MVWISLAYEASTAKFEQRSPNSAFSFFFFTTPVHHPHTQTDTQKREKHNKRGWTEQPLPVLSVGASISHVRSYQQKNQRPSAKPVASVHRPPGSRMNSFSHKLSERNVLRLELFFFFWWHFKMETQFLFDLFFFFISFHAVLFKKKHYQRDLDQSWTGWRMAKMTTGRRFGDLELDTWRRRRRWKCARAPTLSVCVFVYVRARGGDGDVHEAVALALWQNEVASYRMTRSLRQPLLDVSLKKSARIIVTPLAVKHCPTLKRTQTQRSVYTCVWLMCIGGGKNS